MGLRTLQKSIIIIKYYFMQIPSRKHLTTKIISDKFQSVHNDVRSRLQHPDSVCITLDLWTNRQMRSYIGITCHFIENYTLKSALLACKHFLGHHTGQNIARQVKDILGKFDITNKVLNITTGKNLEWVHTYEFIK